MEWTLEMQQILVPLDFKAKLLGMQESARLHHELLSLFFASPPIPNWRRGASIML